MKCIQCGTKLEKIRGDHRYVESGLKNIVLVDIVKYQCPQCDEEEIEIPALSQLHKFIKLFLLNKKEKLTDDEERFLRKTLGYA